MSEVKAESRASGSNKSAAFAAATNDCERCNIQREDLRLDCLRLAAQRQGARDSRGLLEIAEEYYGWVTVEDPMQQFPSSTTKVAPDVIDWPSVKAAPTSHASTRLSLGAKSPAVAAKSKRSARRSRPKSGD